MASSIALSLSVVVGYALGSLPWAYWVAQRSGVHIQTVGTGISGAANVYRNVGHAAGIAVFLLDAGKGAAAVVVAHQLGAEGPLALPALAAAVAAHAYPAFGRFPGGVGLATLCGGAAALGGWVGLAAIAVGVVMLLILRNTGNAGGFGFTTYIIVGLATGLEWTTIAGVLALGVLMLLGAKVRHRRYAALH